MRNAIRTGAKRPESRQPLTYCARSRRMFTSTTRSRADFTHVVIGGGAVGLAIARQLSSVPGTSTLLLERHRHPGTETSSRNSEVIHAGLYYGHDSLKTTLCLKGKRMLYELCEKQGIPYMNCGKWIVAQDDAQVEALKKVEAFAKSIGDEIPVRWISRAEKERREPDVRAEAGVLESSSTGIVDSHSLMQYLLGSFEDNGGECAFNSKVAKIESVDKGKGGWNIWTASSNQDTSFEAAEPVTTETIINSAGLAAVHISNMALPPSKHRTPYYAKGTYFSYSASRPKPSTLVYPAPVPGHGGLGTHLTLDMTGRVRFGPDVEWIDDPTDLVPNTSRLEEALDDIQSYLPGLDRTAVQPDYCGIRPKLSTSGSATAGKGFEDFYISEEKEGGHGVEGYVNLLGIESPGLTSCLAIGEEVHRRLYG
ncbi:MAG: hypothetical protein M1828_006948 [Chrysothrix sp. TS-e1954]|nr:MAG: hypothetical protein M1828_006948 [Chrysothrix sp. TS-e1954]